MESSASVSTKTLGSPYKTPDSAAATTLVSPSPATAIEKRGRRGEEDRGEGLTAAKEHAEEDAPPPLFATALRKRRGRKRRSQRCRTRVPVRRGDHRRCCWRPDTVQGRTPPPPPGRHRRHACALYDDHDTVVRHDMASTHHNYISPLHRPSLPRAGAATSCVVTTSWSRDVARWHAPKPEA